MINENDILDAQDLQEMFDQNPDMLLSDVARITGKTIEEVKEILMPNFGEN